MRQGREFFRDTGEILPDRGHGFNESVVWPGRSNPHRRRLVEGHTRSKAVPYLPGRPSLSPEHRIRSLQRRKSNAVMISDATVQRYYYIYDSRELRTLVMDRVTGEEFSWTDDVRTPLLKYVADQDPSSGEPDGSLRQFALWCAREAGADPSADDESAGASAPANIQAYARSRLLAAAATWIEANGDPPEAVRRETADDVVRAATVGLAEMDPRAASILTAQACTHPDAWRAALDAAHMSERFAEFEAAARPDTLQSSVRTPAIRRDAVAGHAGASSPDAAAQAMRMQQVDHLLDLLHRDDR